MKVFPSICLLFLTLSVTPTAADESDSAANNDTTRPLWEIGVGAGGGWMPDYPAAGENHFRGLGVPFAVYRGDFLRIGDRRGPVRGRFLNTETYEFDISLQAAFPVNSEDNDARRGMPDLDWIIGFGPQLKLKLFNNPGINRLNLDLPVRAVFSTDFSSIANRGYLFSPRLTYRHENLTGQKLRLFAAVGPVFATSKLMEYFYTVQPEFATAIRPVFEANSGYLGSEVILGLSTRYAKKLRLFLGTRVGIYKGAENDDSPLFREDLTVGIFGGFIWSIWQSERRVPDWQ